MATPPTVHLIDGSGYIYRAFYAIRPLSTRAGVPTNAVIGFAKMLNKLLQDEKPTHLAMMFDPRGKTFRHERFPEYKQTRQAMPEGLGPQFALIRDLVERMAIPILEVSGYEADDVIATMVDRAKTAGVGVTIVSADKDLMQLVTPEISMFDPMHDKRYDPAAVEEKWGVPPAKIADVLALTGDSSDNIPGVPKVGKKTAAKWVTTYGDVNGIIEALGKLPNPKAVDKSLLDHAETARLSKQLVTLDHQVPITFDLESLVYRGLPADRLIPFFRDIEAYSLIREFGLEPDTPGGVAPAPAAQEPQPAAQDTTLEVINLDRSTYRALLTAEELQHYTAELAKRPSLAIDLQTTTGDPAQGDILGFALAAHELAPVYVPVGHRYIGMPKQMSMAQALDILAPLLRNAELPKVSHELKAVYRGLHARGVQCQGLADDTSVAAYVLDPGRASYTLDALARDYLGHETIRRRDVVGSGKKIIPFDQVAVETATPYAAESAHAALEMAPVTQRKLQAAGLMPLYRDLEMPLLTVLADMEIAGICVDTAVLANLAVELGERLITIEHQAHSLAGERFNLASTKQLGTLFYEKLGYPVIKRTKTGYSTDAEVLEVLARDYDLPRVVLEHRQLAKLKSTYVDALIKQADPATHRVHTTYNQLGAATGRLSSIDPNLQNIPVRTDEGRRIRSAFVARPGWELLSADYSQIELRILAHLSGDERFVQAFREDKDIHRRTAMEVITEGREPSREDRRRAKAINFGIIYGLSAFGLSRQLGISNREAGHYIERYFANYPGVRGFLDRTIEDARSLGYVTTLLGRRRYLPDLNSRNRTLRSGAERIAMNTPMQGTAADLIKKAMITITQRLRREGLQARLLLQVHDELVFEVPESERNVVARLAQEEMTKVAELAVPLVVDVGSGRTWADAH